MGLFKNLFNYGIGRSLSNNHKNATGIGYMLATAYYNDVKKENKRRTKYLNQKKESICNNLLSSVDLNRKYLNPKFITEYTNVVISMTNKINYDNVDSVWQELIPWIKKLEFFSKINSGVDSIVSLVEGLDNSIMDENKKNRVKKLKQYIFDSLLPYDALEYFDELYNYLKENRIDPENYNEVRKDLISTLNSSDI